ncbi:ABC transporter permease [Streptomyces shenzhenensis]|uniref:ABC transporter permease n=1 Tax=Streptomyces shenzhenensis TaxID=943815 RepID=UPI0037F5FC20
MRRRPVTGLLAIAPPVIVIALFIGLPMVSAVLYTLGDTGGLNSTIGSIAQHQHTPERGWLTLDAYREVFADESFRASLVATIVVTLVATVLVTILGWGIALYGRFHDGPLSRLLTGVSIVPMFIPAVIGAYSMLTFYAPNGMLRTIGLALGWDSAPTFSYTLTGVTLGSVWSNLPLTVLLISSGLGGVSQTLIDASRDAGAGPVRRFCKVILPLTTVPTIIAATFSAIGILGSFTLPYVLGPTARNILGPLMDDTYSAFNMPQQAQVMAVVVFGLALVASIAYVWANYRSARHSEVLR